MICKNETQNYVLWRIDKVMKCEPIFWKNLKFLGQFYGLNFAFEIKLGDMLSIEASV